MKKNVKCTRCPRRFETAEELIKHVSKAHKGK